MAAVVIYRPIAMVQPAQRPSLFHIYLPAPADPPANGVLATPPAPTGSRAGLDGLLSLETSAHGAHDRTWGQIGKTAAFGATVSAFAAVTLMVVDRALAGTVDYALQGADELESIKAQVSMTLYAAGTPLLLALNAFFTYQHLQGTTLEGRGQATLEDLPGYLNFQENVSDSFRIDGMPRLNHLQDLYHAVCRRFSQLPDQQMRDAQRVLRDLLAIARRELRVSDYEATKAQFEKLLVMTQKLQARAGRLANDTGGPALGTATPLPLPDALDADPAASAATPSRLPRTRREPTIAAPVQRELPAERPMPTPPVHRQLLAALVELISHAPDGDYPLGGRREAQFRNAVTAAMGGADKTHWHHGDKNTKQRTARMVVNNVLQQFQGETRAMLENWFELHAPQFL